MHTKIEYVYGERMSGKTTEIIQNASEDKTVGIVLPDMQHRKFYEQAFLKYRNKDIRIGKRTNIILLTKPEHAFGREFDEVYIDEADTLDKYVYESFMNILLDSMIGGKITIYFLKPYRNFSVRILDRKVESCQDEKTS